MSYVAQRLLSKQRIWPKRLMVNHKQRFYVFDIMGMLPNFRRSIHGQKHLANFFNRKLFDIIQAF